MKGNILSFYFRQLSTLCAGGKKKDNFEDFTEFQVYAEKNTKIRTGNLKMASIEWCPFPSVSPGF